MGWGLSMAVVEGLSAEDIAARLEMDLTDEHVDYYTGALHMVGAHRDGRGVVVTDTGADVTPLADERLLTRLSRKTTVLVFEVNEAIDFYMTACWADGMMAWKVTHQHDQPETGDLEVLGSPPEIFSVIAERYLAEQVQGDARGEGIHYYSSIVVDLFVSLDGYRI